MHSSNERKLCECGCGRPTRIATKTDNRLGHVKGQPLRFIDYHYKSKGRCRPMVVRRQGHCLVELQSGHPRANKSGHVLQHILVAEKALGKLLPTGAVVHHINEKPDDNRNNNLVICQDQAYHLLLHQRARAFKVCGHASWRKCQFCKSYEDLRSPNMRIHRTAAFHLSCRRTYRRDKREWIAREKGLI